MMTKNSNHRNQHVPSQSGQQNNGLQGKVALIVCDREEVARPLATGLAQRGVDIALACTAESCSGDVKDEVEAQGRRFLAIGGRVNSENVVEQIIGMFGHLDLFIDCSTTGTQKAQPQPAMAMGIATVNGNGYENGHAYARSNGLYMNGSGRDTDAPVQKMQLFANSALARAALQAITN